MSELTEQIKETYHIAVGNLDKVTGGFLSENYSFESDGMRFFLKKYRSNDAARITEIHSAKRYFAEGGIPVILPIFFSGGKTFFEHGGSFYALFPFVTGIQSKRGSLSPHAIASLGETLGRIHLLGKEAQLPIKESFKLEDTVNTFKKIEDIQKQIRAKGNNLDDFDQLALKNIELKKSLLTKNKLTLEYVSLPNDHLIHGDYLDHNVFFNEAQEVSHVFDFEKTNYSPRTYELFRSTFYGFLSDGNSESDLKNAELYFKSYYTTYPLPDDEARRGLSLFFLKSIHGFWIESEHYLKGNSRVDGFLADDYSRIKYLSEHLEDVAKRFL